MESIKKENLLKAVRERYAMVATTDKAVSCCQSSSCCLPADPAPCSSDARGAFGYTEQELADIPREAVLGLGCGNPGAIADIQPGETVLDIGSGGGIDCFLASKKVGADGRVIGVDMTPEMVSRACDAAWKNGYDNIEFRLGEMAHLPVADGSVDVIISNCVVNLSPDKPGVFSESFRVLKPGGRFKISDMVAISPLPDRIKQDLSLYVGCIAGALYVEDLKEMLRTAGFQEIQVCFKNGAPRAATGGVDGNLSELVQSAMIEAIKPGSRADT